MRQLLGQPRAQRQGVEVFDQAEQLADAPGLQFQQRLVQLHVLRQDLLQVRARHHQHRGVAMRIGIVRPAFPVEDRHVAEPDARLHVLQGHLLARDRGGAHPHRPARHRAPEFRRIAARADQVAILEAFDEGASKDVVAKRW